MLQKWKIILGNWINCYFEEYNKRDCPVIQETLLNIISHLRENFNLDESKSSLLNAHTIHEFILEKYPSFRFDNGTVEPINEDEIYMAASLLLFFVCINSKDMDIKSAMCNKLIPDDQKTILKFTKCLMACTNISSTDVLTAIAEACGQDIAAAAQFTVPETPPALRSLHSEVRRLEAALDAERFDRNYLQEELARTNLKMEKLLKDKEQYKQDIANLKAKSSTCCGLEIDKDKETSNDDSTKLLKQLEQTEERLVNVQEQLDDVQYERDMYKNKLEELKSDRDKWYTLSEQESTKVSQLVEELESERHHVLSLQELVTELRQHNKLNAVDTSQFECDDMDLSAHSFPHNASVCSEACANVVEVQLSEERAKIVLLQQQMQMLQDQLNYITTKSDEEIQNLKQIISDKDTDISNLKQLVNKEVAENNIMKTYYDNEITKLNNEVNELEQRLCDTGENSRRIIDSKMTEIQILQEEKLSLLHSLSNEITKSENVVKDLRANIDAEKSSKLKMREEYERQVMKLNEKVSNRSNEIVELQNKIFEKGEIIEKLQGDLRKEKDVSEEWCSKYNNDMTNLNSQLQMYKNDLSRKIEEIEILRNQIRQHVTYIDALNKDLQHVKLCLDKAHEEQKILEEVNDKLHIDLQNRDAKIEKIQKDIKNQEIINNEEIKKLQYNIDEINATVEALQHQLQNEIKYKVTVQNELIETKEKNNILKEEIIQLNTELTKINLEKTDLETVLVEKREVITKFKKDYANLKENYEQSCNKILEKEELIQLKESQMQEEHCKMDEVIDSINIKLNSEVAEKNYIEKKYKQLREIKEELVKTVDEKNNIVVELETEIKRLSDIVEDKETTIKNLEKDVADKLGTLENVQKDCDIKTTKLITNLNEMAKQLSKLRSTSNNTIEANELEIEKLKLDVENLQMLLQNECDKILVVEKEKSVLILQLEEINAYKDKIEKEYMNKCELLNSVSSQLNEDILTRNKEINELNNKIGILSRENMVNIEEVQSLKSNIEQSVHLSNEKDDMIKNLILKIENMEHSLIESKKEYQNELKKIIDNNLQVVEALKQENGQLHYTIEEDNSTHALLVKEKDKMIETLENKLRDKIDNIEYLVKDFDDEKDVWVKQKANMEQHIMQLTDKIQTFLQKLENNELVLLSLENQIKDLTDERNKLKIEVEVLQQTYSESTHSNDTLKDNLIKEKYARDSLETEKENLVKENDVLLQKIHNIQDSVKAIESERDCLLNEKAILVQQLMEEKSILKIADERKEVLLKERINLDEKLQEILKVKNVLEQEKECLTQQLVDERLSKELGEREKDNVILLKTDLEEKLNAEINLRSELEEKHYNLIKEIELLTNNIEDEKCKNLILEKDITNFKNKIISLQEDIKNLSIRTDSLNNNLLETENTNKLLNNEITMLSEEKEKLTELYNNIKLDISKIVSEKLDLEDKIHQINESFSTEIINKQEEITKLSVDFDSLKCDYKTLKENNATINNVLDCGLNKFFENIKRDEVCLPNIEMYEDGKENRNIDETCNILFKIINELSSELALKKNLEKALEDEDVVIKDLSEKVKQKDMQVSQLEEDIKNLQKLVNESKTESSKHNQVYTTLLETKTNEIQHLKHENESLNHELNDLKVQLDVKVHSLKDKLVDNENLTDKLKRTYECQIDNLNMMISKLTNYLKEKTTELESLRNEKVKLQNTIEENFAAITSLEDELKTQKLNQEKLITDFESERNMLKNMMTVTETVMEDQKVSLNNIISEHIRVNENLQTEIKKVKEINNTEKTNYDLKLKERDAAFENLNTKLIHLQKESNDIQKELESQNELHEKRVLKLEEDVSEKCLEIQKLLSENKEFMKKIRMYEENIVLLEKKNDELKIKNDTNEVEFGDKLKKLQDDLDKNIVLHEKLHKSEQQAITLEEEKKCVEIERAECLIKIAELNQALEKLMEENKMLKDMKNEHMQLLKLADEKDLDIAKLEKRLEFELAQQSEKHAIEKLNLVNKCSILEEFQHKAEVELENRQKEINSLQEELKAFTLKHEEDIVYKDGLITEIRKEKDTVLNELNKEKSYSDEVRNELHSKQVEVITLKNKLEERKKEDDIISILRKENEELVKAIGQRETFAVVSQEKTTTKCSGQSEKDRDLQHQVDNTSTDTHSSMESYKTITDLETIIQDKNRTITTLQSDITFLKTIIAESENNLMDVSKDLEISKENCLQLSNQLKKIVHQKNEEIAELKKQVTKMSATENRASQIIKVSAKYQAIILKRIAEIKSNTVLKELTNFGNTNENDIRKSISAGTITMEDLENFLETTERHIRRCSDKQIVLQKERDRLSEVNRINETEIINIRKFLSELSVSMKTFNSVKELYTQKLSKVVSIQRTVRREILNLDGHITDATMCKLERAYAAIIQDLSECAMNLERWVERCVTRAISPEKIKQAFTSDSDRVSLANGSFQNAGLDVQIEELYKSFEKLLEDISKAQKDGAKDPKDVTLMEVRAEYEDKLNRMKAQMKHIYKEQIGMFKEKQKKDVADLEMELQRAQEKLGEYESHIKSLTTELWNVGEKFLMKKDEAEWLRRKQRCDSLMSLQHVHSSGLVPPQEQPSRPSDAHSLRSLPVTNNNQKEVRTLHMSDEEGEVFDNRWLKELATPRREREVPPGHRISELRWRNSLCPPHLKSSYPAETQFAPAVQEEDIKCINMSVGGRQRKEVGITAYKKPGPPTPSKQAGRLSATDSELRESLRVEVDPSASRKTSTPSRIRSLFRSNKNDTAESTPRSRRLSNIFRKK